MSTALARAAEKGVGNLSEGAAKSALGQALDKMSKVSNKLESVKEQTASTASALVQGAVVESALFLGGFAEGALGDWVTKPMGVPVDARPILAAPFVIWGLYDLMNGGDKGAYALAAGEGIVGSYVVSLGKYAGEAAREKWNAAPGTPGVQPQVSGPVRDVRLTPPPRRNLVRARPRNREEDEDDRD